MTWLALCQALPNSGQNCQSHRSDVPSISKNQVPVHDYVQTATARMFTVTCNCLNVLTRYLLAELAEDGDDFIVLLYQLPLVQKVQLFHICLFIDLIND